MRIKFYNLTIAVVCITVAAAPVFAGYISFIELQRDGVNGVDGLYGARNVTVSPNGKHVYVTGYHEDAVAVFSRDEASGQLTFVEYQKDGIGGVDGLNESFGVTVSPDGNHVYVTGYADASIAVFSRNLNSGRLTFTEYLQNGIDGIDGLSGARSVIVSPDGNHVYTAGQYDNSIAVFSRDTSSGQLSFIEYHKDGVNGVDGLASARNVTISPDGKNVYATGWFDDAVVVFSRDEASGQLTFVEYQKDGIGGVDGLYTPSGVKVSPDGDHVYATGGFANTVVVFSRNAITGELTFIEKQKDGVNGVDGLKSAVSVTVSPDGSHVFVASHGDDAIAVFIRNKNSGQLTYMEHERDGVNGVDGLNLSYCVTTSPDGDHVYATGINDNAVVAFQFIPDNLALPTVSTGSTYAVSGTTVTSGGSVMAEGGTFVNARGVCWSSSPNPTISDSKTVDGMGTGSFTSSISGLSPSSTYYVRAYATNSVGTSYGNNVTITTTNLIFPTVSTGSTFATGKTTATSGGVVITDGGTFVNTRGVCWSSSPNPTISDSKTVDGMGTGSFTSSISGLYPNSTYYVRAYATNNDGTAYGNNYTVTTDTIDIFGMEVGNQWAYDSDMQRKITKIDLDTFPTDTYEMEILSNSRLVGKEWYEVKNEQLLLWGQSPYRFDKGLVAVWFPLSVGEQMVSSAGVVGYTGTTVTMKVDVLSFEKLTINLGTFDAYRLGYSVTTESPVGTSTQTFDWLVVPYLGVIEQLTSGSEETLISFAIGGGNITEEHDTDNDDLLDYQEIFIYYTNPDDSDSDNDGFTDGDEVNIHNTDPNDSNSHPTRAMPWVPLLLFED
jgi:6-phosphogluconolactonase (cycloisomerase 2 family)